MSPQDQLAALMEKHDVVLVYGGPRTGKTWLTRELDCPVVRTDDFINGHEWNEAPASIAREAHRHTRCVIEGVRSLSVTRHGIKPGAVLVMTLQKARLTPKQASMTTARMKVLKEWLSSPAAKGVQVVYEGQPIAEG